MSSATPSPRSSPIWGLVLMALLVVVLAGLAGAYWVAHNGVAATATELPYDQFNHKLDSGQIYKDDKHPLELLIEEGSSIQTLTGFYADALPAKDHLDRLRPFRTTVSLDFDRDLKERLKSKGLTPDAIRDKSNLVAATFLNFLPLILFLLIFGALVRVVVLLLFGARRLPPIPPAPR